jgi:hypothetical protein
MADRFDTMMADFEAARAEAVGEAGDAPETSTAN